MVGAITKAPDPREHPSAIQAPGTLQVEHTSSATSESGEVKDALRLESHIVDLNSILSGHGREDLCFGQKVLEPGPAAFVVFVLVCVVPW